MHLFDRDFDVVKNIETIEWLKTQMVSAVADALKSSLEGSDEELLTALASTVISTFMLSGRLGVDHKVLDCKVLELLETKSRQDSVSLQSLSADLQELKRFWDQKRPESGTRGPDQG